ncbi:MAG: peptide deformylase [Actinomycetota bacterium]
MTYEIRTFGDPVLKAVAEPVANIDEKLVRLTDEMFDVMYKAPGIGLAATQIGVQRQVFVYDIDEERKVILNPQIVESSGEWVYDEGCLSIPGLYVEMLRPKRILVRGINLDGNQVEFEADELLARLFQHEVDHLNGVLMFDRMTPDQRREAVTLYRAREGQPKDAEPYHLKLV